jgi:hypothetical protein
MTVTSYGKRYEVRWTHVNPPIRLFRVAPDEASIRTGGSVGTTECSVGAAPAGRKVRPPCVFGLAHLHPKDLALGTFDPDKGRKVSLANALKMLGGQHG